MSAEACACSSSIATSGGSGGAFAAWPTRNSSSLGGGWSNVEVRVGVGSGAAGGAPRVIHAGRLSTPRIAASSASTGLDQQDLAGCAARAAMELTPALRSAIDALLRTTIMRTCDAALLEANTPDARSAVELALRE